MRRIIVPSKESAELAAAILEHRDSFEFVARGRSMRPHIRSGDVAHAERAEPASLRRGDVILYRSDRGQITAHRIVRVEAEEGRPVFVAAGDAFPVSRERVPADRILARVVGLRRGGKRIDLTAAPRRFAAAVLWPVAALRFAIGVRLRAFAGRPPWRARPSRPNEGDR